MRHETVVSIFDTLPGSATPEEALAWVKRTRRIIESQDKLPTWECSSLTPEMKRQAQEELDEAEHRLRRDLAMLKSAYPGRARLRLFAWLMRRIGVISSARKRIARRGVMNASATGSSAEFFELRPLPDFASQGDILRYIERTRRQLDRFERLPKAEGQSLNPEGASRVRKMCDELEADIIAGLASR